MTPAEQNALTAAHDAYNAVASLVGTSTIEDQITAGSASAVASAVAPLNNKIGVLTADINTLKADVTKASTDAAA